MSRALTAAELETRKARRMNGAPVKFTPPPPEPDVPPPEPEKEDPLPGALESLKHGIEETAAANREALSLLASALEQKNDKRQFHAKFIRNERGLITEAVFTEV